MKLEALDDALRHKRDLDFVSGALDGIAAGNVTADTWFEGHNYDIVGALGEANYRAAIKPALEYARSQIIAKLNALGIEV